MNETGREQGDCLLHADHHEMGEECWKSKIDFFYAHSRYGWSKARIEDHYQFMYEEAVLSEFVRLSLWAG